ncbi:MAG: biotin transporter BioY [Clostridia bacterium]|nr:biotin transporter BioY [Clostridia bacterium]
MKKANLKKLALSSLFVAVIAAFAWLSIPTPFGINLAFSLFGVCLAGIVLDVKWAVFATAVYISLGAIGLPVFSHFTGGPSVLFGASGGFIWGFLITASLCAISKNIKRKPIKYLAFTAAVLLCHICGVIQFSFVTGNNLILSFLTASLPFLLKDIIFVFIADLVAKKIKF